MWTPDPSILITAEMKAAAVQEALRSQMVVSRFQARAALHLAGHLPAVESAIAAADPITQMAWKDAQEFRRNSPTILAMASALGMSDAQVDDLFIAASEIVA